MNFFQFMCHEELYLVVKVNTRDNFNSEWYVYCEEFHITAIIEHENIILWSDIFPIFIT